MFHFVVNRVTISSEVIELYGIVHFVIEIDMFVNGSCAVKLMLRNSVWSEDLNLDKIGALPPSFGQLLKQGAAAILHE